MFVISKFLCNFAAANKKSKEKSKTYYIKQLKKRNYDCSTNC